MESTIFWQNTIASCFISDITIETEASFDAWQTAEWWIYVVGAGKFTARFTGLIE